MARISGNVVNTYVHMDLIVNETGTSTENNSSSLSWQLVGYLGSGASALTNRVEMVYCSTLKE